MKFFCELGSDQLCHERFTPIYYAARFIAHYSAVKGAIKVVLTASLARFDRARPLSDAEIARSHCGAWTMQSRI